MKKIGFIGLGIMGRPMAKNLVKAGYALIVYDRNEAAVKELVDFGASRAGSSKEVAEVSDVVIIMVPNSPQVKEVACGEEGILEGAKSGTIIVDMSSIAPLASKKIHEMCKCKGVRMIDAPVSGGEPKAIDGSLSIMVGGEKCVFEEVYDILMVMGGSAVHCGDIGAGNTTKLANQVVVAANIAAVSEAFLLASQAGVDPQKVFEAIRGGLAGSTVMDAKVPMILEHNFNPGFKIDLHVKDLNNVVETAKELGTPLLLTEVVIGMLRDLQSDGYGSLDHSAIAKYYEKVSGWEIR